MTWSPIKDLSPSDAALASEELRQLGQQWVQHRQELAASGKLAQFTQELNRRWAIETGLIERLYHVDRGITQLLVQHGIDAALIPHRTVGQDPQQVTALITDQLAAAEGLFDFVKSDRPLSTSYLKELHQTLTRHQQYVTALTPEGQTIEVDLLRGEFKKWPNNPRQPDGTTHYYAPPEQVASEVDNLIELHLSHSSIAPEVEAAWLHHRFTQIHPFQDGNGRVARALSSLVFLKAGLLLPVVRDEEDRQDYLNALEDADSGNLAQLVKLFVRLQKEALLKALSISTRISDDQKNMSQLISTLSRDAKRSSEALADQQKDGASRVADALLRYTTKRLEEVQEMLIEALDEERFRIFVDASTGDGKTAAWYRADTLATVKKFDYFANFDAYRGWARLKLIDQHQQVQDEVVIASHGIGRQFRGGIGVVVFSVQREVASEDGMREASREILASEPFSSSYLESSSAAVQRFGTWLEPALLAAIDHFRRAVTSGA